MSRTLVRAPRVRSFRLANGLRVLLAPDAASPTASVWVWYRVGSKNEHPGITGASHWVEHMLFQGSPRYGKGKTDRAVIRVGGELNAFTDTDYTAYFSTVPREHVEVPLDIESDRMTRALLLDDEVERERTVIYSEREGNENWPEFRVAEEVLELSFRVHPYRWDALGYRSDIEHLTPQQLRDYYHRFYGPRNAVFVVAGGFDLGATERSVRRRFAGLPATGDDVTVAVREGPPNGERRASLSGPGTTPYVEMAWRAPALEDPATPATILVDSILGGDVPMFSVWGGGRRGAEHPASRLYRALVDPGLAVRAGSSWHPQVYPDLFSIAALAAPGVDLDRIEERVADVLDRFQRQGPTATEMNDARAKFRRGAALAYEGASHTGFRLGYFATVAPPGFESRLLGAILRTSAREVRDQARRLFDERSRVVVRYTPTGGPSDGE